MNLNEGKIVFNYLKEKLGNERLAYIEYDMIEEDYKQYILKNMIKDYLINHYYNNTLLFDGVNWSPQKRKLRIIDYVSHEYNTMHEDDREIIVEKILNNN
jgi:hypothetical protein